MPSFDFDWVDGFTSEPFGGNGCAVVHDAAALNAETCCCYVKETSLVECTFVEASDVADFRVRYFLASREIPFAGHPTIATVAALLSRERIATNTFTLETGAGLVPIEIKQASGGPLITMTQVAPEFGRVLPREVIAKVGGLDPDDIIADPQIVSTGLPFAITVLRDHDALRRAKLNVPMLADIAAELGYAGTDMLEPYWVTLEGATMQGDTFGRLLLAPPSPPEDPFTGSATGAVASYLWKNGLIERPDYIAEQGHWMGRPGQAKVEVLGPRDAITGVCVAGQGHVLMSGRLHL